MVKVSVIIPVYNVEKYLRECLDSILGQTLRDIEVLCIDDGSTDSSPAILAEYAAADARVRLFRSDRVGAYKARAIGVQAAKGEYIHFMDSDDVMEPAAYHEIVDLADRESLDHVVFTAVSFTDGDGDLEDWRRHFSKRYVSKSDIDGRIMSGAELMDRLIRSRGFFVGLPLRIVRTSVVKGNVYEMPDAPYHADNYYTPVFLHFSKKAVFLDRPYYRRRVRPDSITTSPGAEAKHLRCSLNVILALCHFPGFKDSVMEADSAIGIYLRRRIAGLLQRSPGLARKDAQGTVASLCPGVSPEVGALLVDGVIPLLYEVRRRPNSMLGCLSFILRRVFSWCGREGKKT